MRAAPMYRRRPGRIHLAGSPLPKTPFPVTPSPIPHRPVLPAGSLYSLLDELHAEGISASPCPRLYVRPTQVGLGAWGLPVNRGCWERAQRYMCRIGMHDRVTAAPQAYLLPL